MKAFTLLFLQLDRTTKTSERINALVHYLEQASDQDKLWTIALLSGNRPRRKVNTTKMREWAADIAGIPLWLFEESYHVVGDLAETLSLILPQTGALPEAPRSLASWMEAIIAMGDQTEAEKKAFILNAWRQLSKEEIFVFNKLIGGSFRVGVSQKNMVKALAQHTGKDENELAHRIMGKWDPATQSFYSLILDAGITTDVSKPYPFYLAYPLDDKAHFDASPQSWYAERKWDGIRGQLIKRKDEVFVWTRGEELVTDKYPELSALKHTLPNGIAIDGEILGHKGHLPLPFNDLQRRIGRKTLSKKLLEEVPVKMIAYDLLEWEGEDIRGYPQEKRRALLEKLVQKTAHPHLLISELLSFTNKEDLARLRDESRKHLAEGLMLKNRKATYKVGRKKGDWWKWKVDPMVIDAVLIYAMRGHGRRANLYTDYTFAVWKGKELVPFTKAYSGLTDAEFRQVDRFVKANIIDKFGPVRSVVPQLVFEIAFEGIAKSSRHKSGIALRFPRMSRWRTDKKPEEANTLDDLYGLLDNA